MRSVTRLLRNKHVMQSWDNLHWHLWFSYHNVFFGSLIFRGRKVHAFNMLLKIKEQLKMREHFDPTLVFYVSMLKITPNVMLLSVKKAGVVEDVPIPISGRKQVSFAIKWIIKLLKDSHRVISVSRIVDVLIASVYNKGPAIKKKYELYKLASANRHFIRLYR